MEMKILLKKLWVKFVRKKDEGELLFYINRNIVNPNQAGIFRFITV